MTVSNTKLHTYTQAIKDVLASTGMQAWAEENLGTPWTIFVGLDRRNPPGRKDCPFVIVRPAEISTSPEAEDQAPKILVDWGIEDAGEPTRTGQVVEYDSIRLLDGVAAKIAEALPAAGIPVATCDVALETEAYFPLMLGGMDITLTIPNTIGTIGG